MPQVANTAASNVTTSSATIGGSIVSTGGEDPLAYIYWGATDAAEIEQWILDINDDPGVLATVQFEPFSTDPLPVEGMEKSFGSFKSMFR